MTEGMTGKERRQASDAARADAQFGMYVVPDDRPAGPERMAYEAYERGDHLFSIDIPISYTQGNTATSLTAATRTVHPIMASDYLGAIERQGWHLEHVSTSYIAQGAVGAANLQSAHHGTLTGFFVFRRTDSKG